MMERILALQESTEKPVHLAFRNNRAFLGVNYQRALFEPGIAASTSVEAIHEMAAHFALAEGIVHELDLNTRIWTKDVDESLLHAADASAKDDAFDIAAKQGGLTAEKLWTAAIEATGGGDDESGDAEVVRPGDTSIAIDRIGSGVTINYGFRLGFYVTFLVWAVCVALALAAARELPASEAMAALSPYVAWIPEIPYASAVVTSLPLGWFLGASLVGSLAFLMWAVRVRKVEVTPEAVRIWRGLRPFPRTYSRPPYGKVVRMDKAVYVGKSTGFSMTNASASPMLSASEAPWIAKEMRRAMRETAR